MLTNQSIGYMDAPVPKDIDLREAIDQLRKEKNAVILAHYYQTGDIQDIADYVGDSLALAQWAAKSQADILVLCGVHFMGETAKILCPDKKVLVPDLNAGCSLADSCPAPAFAEFVKAHPGHTVISYVNTTAAVKALTDGLRIDLVDTPLRVTNIKPGQVETNFSMVRFHGDKDRADKVYEGYKPLEAADIAETVWFAASLPEHVQIAEMLVLPTCQATSGIIHKNL